MKCGECGGWHGCEDTAADLEARIAELEQNLTRGLEDAFRDRDLWIKRAEELDTKFAATRAALSNLVELLTDESYCLDDEHPNTWPEVIDARAALANGTPTKGKP